MRARLVGGSLVGLSIVYLALFVPRGWIPHDEGMIGQSAERVLMGDRPHVDYEEPYTGGLAWLHALVFKLAGIDLIYPRWLLFAGAVLAQVITYLILRRYLQPIGAATGTWLALVWSFPNYFAALPSWWVLVCALACVWAYVRFVETGSLRFAAAAGLAAGVSILMKQTGLYVLVALVMALLYDATSTEEAPVWSPRSIGRAAVAVGGVALACVILAPRLSLSRIVYLLLPIGMCSVPLLTRDARHSPRQGWQPLAAPAIAIAVAAIPLLLFVAPYVLEHQVGDLVNGLFVLPQKRVQFARFDLPAAYWIFAAVPLALIVWPLPASARLPGFESLSARVLYWLAGALVVAAGLYEVAAYRLIWQTARSFSAALPVLMCALVLSGRVADRRQRRILFGVAAFLAWASLVQVPFSAPIYFCYVTPLAVIAATAAGSSSSAQWRPLLAVAAGVFLTFAIVSMNRGYLYNLGVVHMPVQLNEPLALDRAALRVSHDDAVNYDRVVELIASHIGGGQLVAGPDAPEVYFLAGRVSPSGTLFDFFGGHVSAEGWLEELPGMPDANVVVLNHRPGFSQGPSPHLTASARRMFPNSEAVGTLEVRWR